MTINSNKDAGLDNELMGQHVITLNDHAESKTYNTAGGKPRTNATLAPANPSSISDGSDGTDGTDGCEGAGEGESAPGLGKVVPMPSGGNPHIASTARMPNAKNHQARPSKSGPALKTSASGFDLFADEKEKDSDRLIRLAGPAFLFHDANREAFASVAAEGRVETWSIRSSDFKHWLTHQYYLDAEGAPSGNAMKEAIAVLEAKAKFVGPTMPVFTRLADYEGDIYLDLANEDRTVVKITSDGWDLVNDAPVKFRRPKGMTPLPTPVMGGTIDELRPFLNVRDETDWMLIVAWLLAALKPTGPYPLAAFHGEHGSAKSTTARVLRNLVDPNSAPVRSEQKDGRDLMISATNGWMIVLDNLSKISDSLSDSLCRLSTGGGFATRTLHTDTDETILNAQRPIIVTGIEELATRGDLLDRSLVITLPAIGSSERKAERKFWAEFDAAQPRILGALLTILAGALRELPAVDLPHLPRMADFAVWVTAAEPALGWERGAFMKAFLESRHRANEVALEASLLATPIFKLIERGPWSGTAEQLLYLLEPMVPESVRRNAEWPRTPRGLAGALRRLNPNLRPLRIEITFDRDNGRGRTRVVTIARRVPSGSSVPSGDTGATDR